MWARAGSAAGTAGTPQPSQAAGTAAVTQAAPAGLLRAMAAEILAHRGMAVTGLDPQQADPDGLPWTPFLYS